ncbi:hypothetical protein TNCV_185261 [Trichonephila clavipes]|nr:hypothetical protein TNCV_185261 [Trichonephila clavipes]
MIRLPDPYIEFIRQDFNIFHQFKIKFSVIHRTIVSVSNPQISFHYTSANEYLHLEQKSGFLTGIRLEMLIVPNAQYLNFLKTTVCQVYYVPSVSARHLRCCRQSKKSRSQGTDDPVIVMYMAIE